MATQVSDTGAKTRTRQTADELAVIAQRAQAFTNSSGTAIALSDGSSDEIICRARSGAAAPEVGTALRVEGSFTGLCIQSGKELRCDDAETDTRVDTAAIRALGIRSMVVTPIKEENRVVGVLAAFAPMAHAFTITHVAVLKTMADQIGQLLQKDRRTRESGLQPETPIPAPVAVTRPLAPMAPVLPAPVVIKPAAPAPSSVPRAVPPAISKVEPIRAAAVVEPLAAPVTPSKREERRGEAKAQPQPSQVNFGTFDNVAAESGKSGNRWILVSAGVIVLAAGATFGYMKMRRPASAESHSQPPAPAASTQPMPSVQPAATNAGSETGSASSSVATSSSTAAKTKDNGNDSSKKADKNSKPSPASPEGKRTPEAVALASGPSRIASRDGDAGQSSDAAPALTVGGSSASGSLNSLTNPVVSSTPSMIAQSTLVPLKVIKRVSPVYPPVARQRLLSATLELEATVDEQGRVKDVRLISGSPIFRDAAFDAVKQWVYQPAKLNGRAIEQKTTIQLFFKP
jgi:TonB family protein